ncbi:MAG: hypothetical protein NTV34_05035 [Proteobacteria bacterium]|nr:hypothetical protein [Pseudomonadota bacterium]
MFTAKSILSGALLLLSTPAISGACCNTPTVWTLKNASKSPISLSCKLISSTAAISSQAVSIHSAEIAAGESFIHNWGADWYSDGMGMIPGTWSCQDARKPKDAGRAPKLVKFSTDWGENVSVIWQDESLSIARAEAAPDKTGEHSISK